MFSSSENLAKYESKYYLCVLEKVIVLVWTCSQAFPAFRFWSFMQL